MHAGRVRGGGLKTASCRLFALFVTITAAVGAAPEKKTPLRIVVRKIAAANGGAQALDKATGYATELRRALIANIKKNKSLSLVGADSASNATHAIDIRLSVHDQVFMVNWNIIALDREVSIAADIAEFPDTPGPDQLAEALTGKLEKVVP